jgi:NAD(P)-dependent dehydrogenase (short-subunit alcohol dehydrogenase family)
VFNGQTVIVTGAGNGLGRAHALLLGRLGANVVVNDLGTASDGQGTSTRAADFVVGEINDAGGSAAPNYDSVATDEGCKAIAATALEAFGRIDAVVHNAGILCNAPFEGMTDERFFPVLETHLLGAFFLSRAVWATMIEQGYGRFVFTSSASGVFGRADGANYASAKAGIVGLCNALALEGEERGVLANAVMPVAMTRMAGMPDDADRTPDAETRRAEGRAMAPRSEPAWVSPLVAFLASDRCHFTHRYYSAGGGRYARIFVGVTAGWWAPDDEPPSPEDIAAHIDEIDDRSQYDLPMSVFEELELMAQRHPS